jgi:cell surface protein SprA
MDMTKNFVKNHSEEFRNPSAQIRSIDSIQSFNRFDEGSYTVSYFTANTFFKNIDEVFNTFVSNRPLMSNILNPTGTAHGEYQGYKQGYGPTNQDVLIPSFIAAYTGKDLSQVSKDVFKQRPALNWRLTYNGLAKLPGLKNIFSSINITHGYKSTLTVNQFRTEPFYDDNNPTKTVLENPYDYYTQFDIPTVVITEQFAPLFGIDVNLKTGATFGVSYRKSRNLGLSISDTRLQETNTKDFTIKFGHRVKNVYIKFLDFDLEKKKKKPTKAEKEKQEAEAAKNQDPNAPKKKREPKPKKGNDLVLNFDLTFRDDISRSHLLGPGTEVPTRGNKTIRVAPSATYTVNRRLDLRFYVDYNQIIPYTTASFNTINASGGFVITFKLN